MFGEQKAAERPGARSVVANVVEWEGGSCASCAKRAAVVAVTMAVAATVWGMDEEEEDDELDPENQALLSIDAGSGGNLRPCL